MKSRRCYCGRLYPGFQCAYCRLAEELADDPSAPSKETFVIRRGLEAEAPAEKPTLWSRISALGKSVLRK